MTQPYPPYDPQEWLSAPARPMCEAWRTLAGLILGAALFAALAQVVIGFFASLVPGALQPGTAAAALALLLTISAMGLSAVLVVTTLHRRPPHTLIGDSGVARRDFRRVATPMAVLMAVILLVMVLFGELRPLAARPVVAWLALLPVALTAILLQSAAEELVFRGYLQQQLAARFRNPAIWIGLPAALFAVLHHEPSQYGNNAGLVTAWAGLFALCMGDLTARTGSLGAAVAVHFVMNVSSFLVVALPGPAIGLALFVLPFGPDDEAALRALLPAEFLGVVLAWLTARLALRV